MQAMGTLMTNIDIESSAERLQQQSDGELSFE